MATLRKVGVGLAVGLEMEELKSVLTFGAASFAQGFGDASFAQRMAEDASTMPCARPR